MHALFDTVVLDYSTFFVSSGGVQGLISFLLVAYASEKAELTSAFYGLKGVLFEPNDKENATSSRIWSDVR